MNNLKTGILDYDLYIFDCDGVVLDSNALKTEAFYKSVLEFGENNANTFIEYHKANGGVSRYQKFKYFFDTIYPSPNIDLDIYIEKYARLIQDGYLDAKVTDGFSEFIHMIQDKSCYVVSASDERELNELFKYKNILQYFKGVYGSPNSKIKNIQKYIDYKGKKILFIGDSKADLEASQYFNFDFLFMYGYTEIDLNVDFKIKNFEELI